MARRERPPRSGKAEVELCYERAPGAASAPLQPKTYRPRQPQDSVLYRLVQEHLETFLEQSRLESAGGDGLPYYVERSFYRMLECGQLSAG